MDTHNSAFRSFAKNATMYVTCFLKLRKVLSLNSFIIVKFELKKGVSLLDWKILKYFRQCRSTLCPLLFHEWISMQDWGMEIDMQ